MAAVENLDDVLLGATVFGEINSAGLKKVVSTAIQHERAAQAVREQNTGDTSTTEGLRTVLQLAERADRMQLHSTIIGGVLDKLFAPPEGAESWHMLIQQQAATPEPRS